jgi:hypothetical protein
MKTDFKPGDIVKFCDQTATVIDNKGEYGIVRHTGATHNSTWDWMKDGHVATLVTRANS